MIYSLYIAAIRVCDNMENRYIPKIGKGYSMNRGKRIPQPWAIIHFRSALHTKFKTSIVIFVLVATQGLNPTEINKADLFDTCKWQLYS